MAERGGSAGVGDMRRTALVIVCGNSDLHAMIASNWSDGGGFKYDEGGDQSDVRASRSRPGDGTTAKTAPPLGGHRDDAVEER